MHKKDIGMKAEWHFFATSHGKNVRDGVGGTIKRLAAHASLQRAIHNQILNPHQLCDFAKNEILSITCFFVDKQQVDVVSKFWHPDMKMPDNLEETEKTISLFPMVTMFYCPKFQE